MRPNSRGCVNWSRRDAENYKLFYIPQTFDFEDASGADSKAASRNGFGKALEEKTRPETLLVTKTREDNNPFSAAVFSLVECTPIMLDLGLDFSAQFVEMLKDNEDPCARIL